MGRSGLWILTCLAACGRLNFDPLGGDGDSGSGSGSAACFQQLAAGDRLTCTVRSDTTVWCAGWNTSGQLGANNTATAVYHSAVPLAVVDSTTGQPLSDATNVVTTNFAGCVHKTDGSVWCWGYNSTGAVGDGTNTDRIAAVETLPAGSATAIAAGWRHVCAIGQDATLSCWGRGTSGELGDGANMSYRTPTPVPGLANVTSMTGGQRMTCATFMTGTRSCWGDNTFGQLGDGTMMAHSTPSPVQGSVAALVRTTHGREHSCGIDASGTVWCWGTLRAAHDRGTSNVQLLQTYGTAPVQILADVTDVKSGPIHVCAVKTDRTVWCWGSNSHGQLGDGTLTDSLTPVQVIDDSAAPLTGVLEIAVGARHSCARRADGIWCWGWGVEGQLANGSYANTTSRAQPTMFACP